MTVEEIDALLERADWHTRSGMVSDLIPQLARALREQREEAQVLRAVAVASYRHWSEQDYAASFLAPSVEGGRFVQTFVDWLGNEDRDGGWPRGEDYEDEMIAHLLRFVRAALASGEPKDAAVGCDHEWPSLVGPRGSRCANCGEVVQGGESKNATN